MSVCCTISANILLAKPSYMAKPRVRAGSYVANRDIDGAGRGILLMEGPEDGAYLSVISNSTSLSKISFSLVFLFFRARVCVCVCVASCFWHDRYSIEAQGIELFTFLFLLRGSIAL